MPGCRDGNWTGPVVIVFGQCWFRGVDRSTEPPYMKMRAAFPGWSNLGQSMLQIGLGKNDRLDIERETGRGGLFERKRHSRIRAGGQERGKGAELTGIAAGMGRNCEFRGHFGSCGVVPREGNGR